jgi:hypothetical protein
VRRRAVSRAGVAARDLVLCFAELEVRHKVLQSYSPADLPIHAKSGREREPENAGSLTPFRMTFSQRAEFKLTYYPQFSSQTLLPLALGLTVAIPAVMMFNYFTTKIRAFDVEMDNSSSELVYYFLKRAVVMKR